MTKDLAPVITIDGLAATGKGSVRSLVAHKLKFQESDSGVLYRALGFVCHTSGIPQADWAKTASDLKIVVKGQNIFLDGVDRTVEVRSSECDRLASLIAQDLNVRQALLDFQLRMRRMPGLVADGRDQGFIYSTPFRFFLMADVRIKAERRVRQLQEMNQPADFEKVLVAMIERDRLDTSRSVAPTVPHPKARMIDTTNLSVSEVVQKIVRIYRSSCKVLTHS